MFVTNEVNIIDGNEKLIKISKKLLKTRKLFKLRKSKSKKIFQSQNLAK